jgi:hypothetical protein
MADEVKDVLFKPEELELLLRLSGAVAVQGDDVDRLAEVRRKLRQVLHGHQ